MVTNEITLTRQADAADDSLDHTQYVQDAIDSLPESGGVLQFRGYGAQGKPWSFSRPVMVDKDFVTLEGLSRNQVYLSGTSCYGPVLGGLRNVRKASLSHWYSAASLLDATAISDQWGTPTLRYAVRTLTPSGVYAKPSFSASPFSEGPHQGWRAVSKLTFDFAFILHAVPGSQRVSFFGCQDSTNRPGPYYLACFSLYTFLDLCTETNDRLRLRILWTPFATAGQLVRLSVQVALDGSEPLAFVNGQKVIATTDGVPTAGHVLHQPDEGLPFGLGGVACESHRWDQTLGAGPTDLSVLGFKLTADSLYTPATVQTRLDGQPVTDRLRYFQAEPKTLAFLPLDEIPADRLIRWQSPPLHDIGMGDVRGFGYLLNPANAEGGDTVGGLVLRDLMFGGKSPYGSAFAYGTVPDLIAERCWFEGGAYAFHSLNVFCGYPVTVRDSKFFGGWIAGLRARNQDIDVVNSHFHAGRRHSICVTGCTVDMAGGTMDGNANRVSSVKMTEGQYGSGFSWRKGYIDFEGPYPSVALFDLTASAAVAQTLVTLEGIGFPGVPPGRTLFVLRPRRAQTSYPSPARLSARDCGFIGNVTVPMANGAALARQMGPGWSVETAGDPWSSRPQGVPLLIDENGNEAGE